MAKFDFKNVVKKNKNLKYGGYATIVTAIACVILIVLNLMFEQLHLTIDLTEEELYSVSKETMDILDELDQDVDIYGFYASGDETGTYSSMVVTFLERYENLSDHLHFEIKDPVNDPAFANQFITGPDETISSGNVVVTAASTGRYKILALSDMLKFSYDSNSSQGYRVSGWDAEGAITGAVQYVTSEKTPAIYQLTGHGESTLYETVVTYLNKSNFDVETISLMSGDSIDPSTFNTILVNTPQHDLTDDEYNTLIDYMENGGRMIFLTEYNIPELPNFDKLLSRFGFSIDRSNFILETNTDYFYNNYNNLTRPDTITTGDAASILDNISAADQICFPWPTSIEISEQRNRSTNISVLLQTSDDALIKMGENQSLTLEDGDKQGPFVVCAIATEQEQIGTEVHTAELCVIGSSTFIDYSAIGPYSTDGNNKLFLSICNYMQDEVSSLYIPPKTFTQENLLTSMRQALVGGIVFVIVIPAVIIICGVIIWKRRKKL